MPAIVALVAGNFPPRGRPRAYGLVMAAGAIAVAVGPSSAARAGSRSCVSTAPLQPFFDKSWRAGEFEPI